MPLLPAEPFQVLVSNSIWSCPKANSDKQVGSLIPFIFEAAETSFCMQAGISQPQSLPPLAYSPPGFSFQMHHHCWPPMAWGAWLVWYCFLSVLESRQSSNLFAQMLAGHLLWLYCLDMSGLLLFLNVNYDQSFLVYDMLLFLSCLFLDPYVCCWIHMCPFLSFATSNPSARHIKEAGLSNCLHCAPVAWLAGHSTQCGPWIEWTWGLPLFGQVPCGLLLSRRGIFVLPLASHLTIVFDCPCHLAPPPCYFLFVCTVRGSIGTGQDYSCQMWSSARCVARPVLWSQLASLATLCAPPNVNHNILICIRWYSSFICLTLPGGLWHYLHSYFADIC